MKVVEENKRRIHKKSVRLNRILLNEIEKYRKEKGLTWSGAVYELLTIGIYQVGRKEEGRTSKGNKVGRYNAGSALVRIDLKKN